ncbi:SigE family RNA polymerase sigma factor [Amorphoplanes digitatis]|uniref:RNA polymerase sigma-70 factor (ECF subfamily) n=1 Tax=Actinoplanes digitatis TaxID=1868 RepID=A0A7W7MSS1_9ACTN|nr:SigE family RNA polymerase sigma factor [Actinoplanes digitatis]MBB4765005.1 RNA polymerase sigma-70 factor (ECF subfamily) [Actinoplanes digitatis]BFE74679.1 SigE family RNA polymerase sigma factor [Actinoplanes digitatis]GID93902.1 RNA polymerase sigma24 factor [Actinoplanes digitatis]
MRDAEDFDTFYATSSRRVLAHVAMMVGGRAEAEDSVAEAYLRAWNRWHRISRYDNPEAWVRQVAYRHAVSAWRKAVNRLYAHRRDAGDGHVEALSPDHVAIVAALRRIPADQRRVIVLHHLVGLSVAEIKAETGVPAGTVTTWLARGRRAMAAHLSDNETDREHRDV